MTPLHTIAVGFDGSPAAQAAVTWAFRLSTPLGADVVIVHAVGLLERLEHGSASLDFQQSIGQLAEDVDFDTTHLRWHVSDGDACSVMLRMEDPPIHADLLVVGSRGQGKHAGLVLGSTSLQLAERAFVPVVIVPMGRDFD